MQPTLVIDNHLAVPHLLPHLGLGVPLLLSLLHHVSEDAELLLADVPTADLLRNHLDSAVTEIFELDLPQEIKHSKLVEGEAVVEDPLVDHIKFDCLGDGLVRLEEEFHHGAKGSATAPSSSTTTHKTRRFWPLNARRPPSS